MSSQRRPVVWRLAGAAALTLVGAAACTSADSRGESTGAASASDSVAPAGHDAAVHGTGAAWYDRSRSIDLTGDGRPDTVRLSARGARPDSLQVRMMFVVDGEEKHREEWGSSYELEFRDTGALRGPQLEALLRARLDTVLASVVTEPLAGRIPGLMAEDSAILKDISPWPRERVIFSYGFESQPNLFWDAPRRRFVRLWSCC